jgi:hypothetical protein
MGALAGDVRPAQKKVAVSPRFHTDSVMFATAYQDLMVSRDRGVTWDTVLTLPNTLTSGCTPGCAYCRASDPRAVSAHQKKHHGTPQTCVTDSNGCAA